MRRRFDSEYIEFDQLFKVIDESIQTQNTMIVYRLTQITFQAVKLGIKEQTNTFFYSIYWVEANKSR